MEEALVVLQTALAIGGLKCSNPFCLSMVGQSDVVVLGGCQFILPYSTEPILLLGKTQNDYCDMCIMLLRHSFA